MIAETVASLTTRISRRAATLALALSVSALSASAFAQAPAATTPTAAPAAGAPAAPARAGRNRPQDTGKVPEPISTVPFNPRAPENDPRIGLKPGLYDAGTAISGMKLIANLPKPTGFAPDVEAIKKAEVAAAAAAAAAAANPPAPGAGGPGGGRGAGGASAAAAYGPDDSDLAFAGKYLIGGNYNGINFYDISSPAQIKLVTSLVCPGGQGDVSVYGHLVFMSVETSGRLDCGTQGLAVPPPAPTAGDLTAAAPAGGAPAGGRGRAPAPPDPMRMRGVRIFDISDLAHPKQVADVQTCRGSHTHTLVVDPKDKDNVYIYVSGTAGVRPKEELAGCVGGNDDPDTAVFTVVVIKVPVAHPELAKVVNSPRIFADAGKMGGLMSAPVHGAGEGKPTTGCHDITVRSDLGLAAGACSGNGILLDISDPVNPKRLDVVSDPNYSFWHSANFSNDGTKLLFTDEWGGGSGPNCKATDPMIWGADAIFQLKDRKLTLESYYKMPAAQTASENCVAHNGSLIPVPGRDILVQSWYQGGVSIVDFTDQTHPVEIAYFDRGPINTTLRGVTGGQWSTYWYNGYIYGSEIVRGIDVFELAPSQYMTQNEIDAAKQVKVADLNVQNQQKFVFPATFTTAKAYVDQLERSKALPVGEIDSLKAALASKPNAGKLNALAAKLDKEAPMVKTPGDMDRMMKLSAILKHQDMASTATQSNGASH